MRSNDCDSYLDLLTQSKQEMKSIDRMICETRDMLDSLKHMDNAVIRDSMQEQLRIRLGDLIRTRKEIILEDGNNLMGV